MNKIISFGIYANQTDKRWNTFIEEMNSLREADNQLITSNNQFYGINRNGLVTHSCFDTSFDILITLDDYFAEGSVYRGKPTFKRGERILVWDDEEYKDEAEERIALAYIEGSSNPVIAVYLEEEENYLNGELFETTWYRFWKPIPTERQKLQQEIEQLEKELNVKRDKLKEV